MDRRPIEEENFKDVKFDTAKSCGLSRKFSRMIKLLKLEDKLSTFTNTLFPANPPVALTNIIAEIPAEDVEDVEEISQDSDSS